MNPPLRVIEDWRKPFIDLPAEANWIAVENGGLCFWYSAKPCIGLYFWMSSDSVLGGFPKHNLGHVRPWIPSEEWRSAIREVMPEERIGCGGKAMIKLKEQWQKPFKNLPAEATWVAVNSSRACFWYQNRPSRGVAIWLPSDLTRVSLYGHIANDVEISDWETAIRPVMPEERINYVKDVKP